MKNTAYSPRYSPDLYEARRAANERSKQYAHRNKDEWTEEDDRVILNEWVGKAATRDEARIAKSLGRTIESCRNHAHHIAGTSMGLRYEKNHQPTNDARPAWADEWEAETGGVWA